MARDVDFNYTASDKTGPASDSVRRRMKKTGDDAERQSKRVTSSIAKGVVDIAESVSPKLAKSLADAFASSGEVGPALLVTGVVAAAPLIGATISGAIIGGIGLGGVVGGFVLAAKDQRVQQAFAGLKADIGSELKDAAQPFVGVSLKGINQIGHAVEDIDFKQIFADSATNAVPLIDGVTTAVEDLGGAIENIIHNSGPVVTEIGREIGALGGSVADGLNSLADNGKQGAEAFHQLFAVVNGTVTGVFQLVNGLTEMYGVLDKISGGGPLRLLDNFAAAHAEVKDKVAATAQALVDSKGAIDQYGQAILTDGAAIGTLSQRMDEAATVGHSLFDSATQAGEAIDRASAAAKKNGKTLDANTAKGRANRAALSQVASALVAKTKAAEADSQSQEQVNKVAGEGRAKFIALARQFGLTKTQAAALATQMGLIPAKKKTDFTANTHDASGRIEALKEQINSISGKTVRVTVQYAYKTIGKPATELSPYGYRGFDARNSFLFAAPGATLRTEPPRPVNVTSNVESRLYLDGSLIYANTAAQVRAGSKRDAWRQRVGRR